MQSSSENPRFSNLLRSTIPLHGAELNLPIDLERLLAERNVQPPPPPPRSTCGDVSDGEDASLTFNRFVAQSTSGNAPTPELRAKFNRFMVMADELVGGSSAASLLSGMGACGNVKQLRELRASVELGFGKMAALPWAEAHSLALHLVQWQQPLKPNQTDAPPASSSSSSSSSSSLAAIGKCLSLRQEPEYGHDLPPFCIAEEETSSLMSLNLDIDGGSGGGGGTSAAVNANGGAAGTDVFSLAALEDQEEQDKNNGGGGSGEGKQEEKEVPLSLWLWRVCEKHGKVLPPSEICGGILAALGPDKDPGQSQAALFELLGESALDTMVELLGKAQALGKLSVGAVLAHSHQQAQRQRATPGKEFLLEGGGNSGGGGGGGGALSSSQITVRSAAEVEAQKRLRKEQRRTGRQQRAAQHGSGGGGGDTDDNDVAKDWLLDLGFDEVYLEEERALGLQGGAVFNPRHEATRLAQAQLLAGPREYHNTTRTLPAGTTREWFDGYEQVYIPPPPRLPLPAHGELVDVGTALPAWAAPAFQGMKTLNRIQSAIFPIAFQSAENMLVCAPTGAGKTNCAMLALLQLVGTHVDPATQVLDRTNIKCCYIAPMKALAQEVVETFQKRLSGLGLVVRELTGDMQLTRAEVDAAHLIVTTPEKWDVITRKGGTDGSLATKCKLVIIDEVHLLADERGAVIESVVARTQRLVESAQTTVRIVALSATLPNYKDVALFLRVNPERGLFYFGGEYRPVPLEQTFIGCAETQNKNRFQLAAKQNQRAYDIALESVQKGHQVMVFVHARKDTVRTAQALRELAMKDGCLDDFDCGKPPDNEEEDGEVDGGDGAGAEVGGAGGAASQSKKKKARPTTNGKTAEQTQEAHGAWAKQVAKSKNAELKELFGFGFVMHHAGMLRADRSLVEKAFYAGAAKVLVCTATLAWGVNLPAHTVVIKGTEVYDPSRGGAVDLSMLDVMQIFGRAGRPQFDSSGEAFLITTHSALPRYLQLVGHQTPIESNFLKALPDHLNAEVASGTVTNIQEAVAWLSYTYLFVRMLKNPLGYGMDYDARENDPELQMARYDRCTAAAKKLDEHRMLRFDPRSGNLAVTDLGRTASHFYIQHGSIEVFNHMWSDNPSWMSDAAALNLLCHAKEFTQIRVRPEEVEELAKLKRSCCPLEVKPRAGSAGSSGGISISGSISGSRIGGGGGSGSNGGGGGHGSKAGASAVGGGDDGGGGDDAPGKVCVLLQAHISQVRPTGFTLVSDCNYVAQNGARVCRALFEVALRKGHGSLAAFYLRLAKSIDRRLWWWECPLRQLQEGGGGNAFRVPDTVLKKLEARSPTVEQVLDMDAREVGSLINFERLGLQVLNAYRTLPRLSCEVNVQPVTRQILRLTVTLNPTFKWQHGNSEPFWVWVGDSEGNGQGIYHSEYVTISRKKGQQPQHSDQDPNVLSFTIPISEPLPSQYVVHVLSDRWVGDSLEMAVPVSFKHLVLPETHPPHTDLLDLTPLPLSALQNKTYEAMYDGKLTHFNPIQTQVFHTLYHTDRNVLLGAPTSSGKTMVAELAILRMLNQRSTASTASSGGAGGGAGGSGDAGGVGGGGGEQLRTKAVYIAPLKALARERVKDWKKKLGGGNTTFNGGCGGGGSSGLGLTVLELTGDVTPDAAALKRADVIITTPEKWDGVTRSWRSRAFVRSVRLVIIDEIHLLGEDRGPVLEVIVSRMRYIAAKTSIPVRLVGLSTALANAHDLADWLGISPLPGRGLFNFRPSVRPVPMEVHMRGFPGQHYCPRMATMNKPTYSAIIEHSPKNPVLVFVASRRQTRLTALDLISFCASEDNPKQFLHMDEVEMEAVCSTVKDEALRHTLLYGVGLHHAGLNDHDRTTVEELFVSQKIQVLVCTSTLAWGVNFPARLVVVKGTEFFDGKQGRYVDFPVTDVLQMMGRAGRPQFDDKGVACVFVHAPKKQFYKKFLYEPFPVESSLIKPDILQNHLSAEVAGGTIKDKQDAVEYLTWTYFFRRLLVNPAYYHCEDSSTSGVQAYLLDLVDSMLEDLQEAGCVEILLDQAPHATQTPPLTLTNCDKKAAAVGGSNNNSGGDGGGKGKGKGFSAAGGGGNGKAGAEEEDKDKDDDGFRVRATTAGMVAAYYYIDYRSVRIIQDGLELLGANHNDNSSKKEAEAEAVAHVTKVLCDTQEFAELPVRHNEEELNGELAKKLPWKVDPFTLDSPHTKAFLLVQAHCHRAPLPISDFINDQKSVMDQALRVLNAMVDISADEGLLKGCLACMRLAQLIVMAVSPQASELTQLPHVRTSEQANALQAAVVAAAPASTTTSTETASSQYRGRGGGKGGGKGSGKGTGSSNSNKGNGGGGMAAAAADTDSQNNGGGGSSAGGVGALRSLMAVGGRGAFRLLSTAAVGLTPPQAAKACAALEALPLTSLRAKVVAKKDANDDTGGKGGKVVAKEGPKAAAAAAEVAPVVLCPDADCSLEVEVLFEAVSQHSQSRHRSGREPRRKLATPFFHKPRDLGFWLVLGSEGNDELLALKKVSMPHMQQGGRATLRTELAFAAPLDVGPCALTLRLVADSVKGIDVTEMIHIRVAK